MSAALLVLLLVLLLALPVAGWALAVRHWEGERQRQWDEMEARFWEEHSEERTAEAEARYDLGAGGAP